MSGSVSRASGARDAEWLVVQYLHSNEFFDAEKALLKQLAGKYGVELVPPKHVPRHDYLKRLVMSKLYYKSVGSGKLDHAGSFRALHDFVMALLDSYREDLRRLLHPIFIHCVLDLVYTDQAAAVPALYEQCRALFTDTTAGRAKEIDQVRRLQSIRDIEVNPVASKYWGSPAHATVSQQSLDLLLEFLHDKELFCIIKILHNKMDIQPYPGPPRRDRLAPVSVGRTVPAAELREAASVNAGTVSLGLLQGCAEDKANRERRASSDEAGGGSKSKSKAGSDPADRIKPPIPVVALPADIEAMQVKELKIRVSLGVARGAAEGEAEATARLPSICCCTATNSHRMLASSHVVTSEQYIACGFSDSSIRLAPLKSRSKGGSEAMEVDAGEDAAADEEEGDPLAGQTVPGEFIEMRGHSGAVCSISSTSEGSCLLSASFDGTVRLWSLELRESLVSYEVGCSGGAAWCVAACPRQPFFAAGSWDGVARVWSSERPQPLRMLVGHSSDVGCLAWHPNCKYLVTGSNDCTLRMWDVATGKAARMFVGGHGDQICDVAVSPDGKLAASASVDGGLALWDLASGRLQGRAAPSHARGMPVWTLSFDKDSRLLASGGSDCCVRLWDVRAGTLPKGGAQAGEAAGKDSVVMAPVAAYQTKDTPVTTLHFTRTNLLVAIGEFNAHAD